MSQEDMFRKWMKSQTDGGTESSEKRSQSSEVTRTTPEPYPEVPASRRSEPAFIGRLAEHLAKQSGRDVMPDSYKPTSEFVPWTADDVQTKAVIAMALVLVSNLAKYAKTTLSETKIIRARDALLHSMSARDAVQAEVEAYELLSWFAATLDESWKPNPEAPVVTTCGSSGTDVIRVIESAKLHQRNLQMEYYTHSRVDFSERIVTPIEVAAEKYLIAFCHTRQEERVFRLSRILKISELPNSPNDGPLLSYPCPEDTKLPPLPERDVPKTVPKKSEKKSSSKPPSKPKKNGKDTKTAQPTLFDVPDGPQKKKNSKAKKQSFLPGFE